MNSLDNLKVKLSEFPNWFEKQLKSITQYEMDEIAKVMNQIDDSVKSLKALSIEYKNSQSLHAQPLINRMQKMCEHIESLNAVFSSKPLSKHGTLLIDAEFLKELITKLKSKLKTIDDLASMRKVDLHKVKSNNNKPSATSGPRSDSGSSNKKPTDIALIREEVRNALSHIDSLEALVVKKVHVLEYFSEIKAVVHKPIQEMNSKSAQLPNLGEVEKQLLNEGETLKKVLDNYNHARSVEILAKMARIKVETDQIHAMVEEARGSLSGLILQSSEEGHRLLAESLQKSSLAILTTICSSSVLDLFPCGNNE